MLATGVWRGERVKIGIETLPRSASIVSADLAVPGRFLTAAYRETFAVDGVVVSRSVCYACAGTGVCTSPPAQAQPIAHCELCGGRGLRLRLLDACLHDAFATETAVEALVFDLPEAASLSLAKAMRIAAQALADADFYLSSTSSCKPPAAAGV